MQLHTPAEFTGGHWNFKHKNSGSNKNFTNSRIASDQTSPVLKGIHVSWRDAARFYLGKDILQVVDKYNGKCIGKFLYTIGEEVYFFADNEAKHISISFLDSNSSKWRLEFISDCPLDSTKDKSSITTKEFTIVEEIKCVTSTGFAHLCSKFSNYGFADFYNDSRLPIVEIRIWVVWECVQSPLRVTIMRFYNPQTALAAAKKVKDDLVEKTGIACDICVY